MQQIQGPKTECFGIFGMPFTSFVCRDAILSDDLASRSQTHTVSGFTQTMAVQICMSITGGSSKELQKKCFPHLWFRKKHLRKCMRRKLVSFLSKYCFCSRQNRKLWTIVGVWKIIVFNGLIKYSSQSLASKLRYYSHYDCDTLPQHPERVH